MVAGEATRQSGAAAARWREGAVFRPSPATRNCTESGHSASRLPLQILPAPRNIQAVSKFSIPRETHWNGPPLAEYSSTHAVHRTLALVSARRREVSFQCHSIYVMFADVVGILHNKLSL